jgi:predicted nucleotidyltransferase
MEDKFNELINRLQTALGDKLVSVIVYGSAVAILGNPKKSDYKTLVVTYALGADELKRARPAAQWWVGENFPLPVFFTRQEFIDSLDVFPVEFRQMKRAYRVLYGEDLLAPREAARDNLRWQVEYELRGKLLRLRSLYLPESASTERLTKLMTDSVVSFVRFLRPVLEILDETPPIGRLATVGLVGERLKIDVTPLERLLRLRDEPVKLLEVEAQDLFASYVDCLGNIIAAVDKL